MWTSGAGHCIDMDQFAGPLAFIAHYRLRFEGGQPSKADAQHCSEPAGDSWAHSFDRRDGPGRRGAGLSSRIRASVMMHSLSARPEVRQTLGGGVPEPAQPRQRRSPASALGRSGSPACGPHRDEAAVDRRDLLTPLE